MFKVPPDTPAGLALIDFLAARLELSRKKTKSLIDRRCVFVNRRRAWIAGYKLKAGDKVEVFEQPPAGAPGTASSAPAPNRPGRSVRVLYEDDDLLVVAKPAGIETNGSPRSLEEKLRAETSTPALSAVHRLDRDTTGALIFAKTPGTRERMIELFRAGGVEKRYLVIVRGRCVPGRRVSTPIDGKPALTVVERVLAQNMTASYLDVRIESGRTHQIRLHLAQIGCPVVGDAHYMTGEVNNRALRAVPRQMVHANKLRFRHPFNERKNISISCRVPEDFELCLSRLNLR